MSSQLSENISRMYNNNKLPWIIICIGIGLRLVRYLYNPSFWFDESVYATDIAQRSFSALILPSPDWSSTAPFLFFITEKFATHLFGNSEYAFRLFPLLFGVISMFLFYIVAKYFIRPKAVPVALALFAILDPMVIYSSELKPYSGDVAFALFILSMTAYFQSKKTDITRIALFAAAGAVAVWISHASVFVLAGVGTSLAFFYVQRKEWSKAGSLLLVCTIWAISFLAVYFVYTRNAMASTGMRVEDLLKLEQAFMPFPPLSLADARWYIDAFFETFNSPAGFHLKGIASLVFLIGCVSLFADGKERFFILISPILITLFAAAMHTYPFKGRLILFLVPLIILFIAQGVAHIHNKTKNTSQVITSVIVVLLFVYPLLWATYHIKKPFSRSEIKPVLEYIENEWQDGDLLYVHFYSEYAFQYYSKYHPDPYRFHDNDYVIGIAPRGWYNKWRKKSVSRYYNPEEEILQSNSDILNEYVKDLNKLRGKKRVWVLFTEDIVTGGIRDEKFFLYHLDTIGKRLASFGRSGLAIVYLYDLS